MSQQSKAILQETARSRLPCIRELLISSDTEESFFLDNLRLSRNFLTKICESFAEIAEGKDTNYEALYKSITLEMIANSHFWNRIRFYARDLCH